MTVLFEILTGVLRLFSFLLELLPYAIGVIASLGIIGFLAPPDKLDSVKDTTYRSDTYANTCEHEFWDWETFYDE